MICKKNYSKKNYEKRLNIFGISDQKKTIQSFLGEEYVIFATGGHL